MSEVGRDSQSTVLCNISLVQGSISDWASFEQRADLELNFDSQRGETLCLWIYKLTKSWGFISILVNHHLMLCLIPWNLTA